MKFAPFTLAHGSPGHGRPLVPRFQITRCLIEPPPGFFTNRWWHARGVAWHLYNILTGASTRLFSCASASSRLMEQMQPQVSRHVCSWNLVPRVCTPIPTPSWRRHGMAHPTLRSYISDSGQYSCQELTIHRPYTEHTVTLYSLSHTWSQPSYRARPWTRRGWKSLASGNELGMKARTYSCTTHQVACTAL